MRSIKRKLPIVTVNSKYFSVFCESYGQFILWPSDTFNPSYLKFEKLLPINRSINNIIDLKNETSKNY